MINLFENIILIFILLSSLSMLLVKNPVQSLIWLIVTFMFMSIVFMILGAELMSILIFMIYIGAIAVLFLFVVMMLNIKIVELKFYQYIPIGISMIFF